MSQVSPARLPEDAFRQWKPEVQERALALIAEDDGQKPFFCTNRHCDGEPHGKEWDFNHARSDQRPPNWSRDWLTWLLMSGRGAGKALDVSTPVPTPDGWTTMGALRAGDVVLGSDGKPCRVLKAHQPYVAEAHRVLFSDGTSLDADADHQWSMWSRADRRGKRHRRVVTTAQIAHRLTVAGERNWRAPVANALDLPDAELPIDPWVLGFWLGDGSSATSDVTVGDKDIVEVEALFRQRGLPLTKPRRKPDALCATYAVDKREYSRNAKGQMQANGSLHSTLRAEGLIRNKHVPLRYLRASRAQREDLLAGLIDSDGFVSDRGYVEITVCNETLSEGIEALIRTLGHRATRVKSTAMLHGVPVGTRYRVSFTARSGGGFLKRKQINRPNLGQPDRLTTRMVDSVTPIGPRLMRCITVDSKDSCYLAGQELLVTHNTRTGSEVTNRVTELVPRIALIGATGPDFRETMVEGPSGILACAPKGEMPTWEPSRKRLTWPNGCIAQGFSGEEPDRVRGGNFAAAWIDEPAHIDLIEEVWGNLLLALRIGANPHIICTTTPRPTKWMKKLVADPRTITVRVSTYANLNNLSPVFRQTVLESFEGTRWGRQELHGEILEDVEGSLWKSDMFRYIQEDRLPEMDRIVVAVDPAGSCNPRSDDTGIIVIGAKDGRLYILADRTGKYSPKGWAEAAHEAYEEFRADAIVAEKNYGGDMVRNTLENVGYSNVRILLADSRRGKQLRAEPTVALYERELVYHVTGDKRNDLLDLENEQVEWVPGKGASPNRVDALVHGSTELIRGWGGPVAVADPNKVLGGFRSPTSRYLA